MKKAKVILVFQPYFRSGSRLSLIFPDPDMDKTVSCSDYGMFIGSQMKEHLTLLDEVYGTDYLNEITTKILEQRQDFANHVSRCHAFYGNAAPDSVKQLIELKEKYDIDTDNIAGITSSIVIEHND